MYIFAFFTCDRLKKDWNTAAENLFLVLTVMFLRWDKTAKRTTKKTKITQNKWSEKIISECTVNVARQNTTASIVTNRCMSHVIWNLSLSHTSKVFSRPNTYNSNLTFLKARGNSHDYNTVKPVLGGHHIKRTPSIKRTLAEVPKFISLIFFKWNLY